MTEAVIRTNALLLAGNPDICVVQVQFTKDKVYPYLCGEPVEEGQEVIIKTDGHVRPSVGTVIKVVELDMPKPANWVYAVLPLKAQETHTLRTESADSIEAIVKQSVGKSSSDAARKSLLIMAGILNGELS